MIPVSLPCWRLAGVSYPVNKGEIPSPVQSWIGRLSRSRSSVAGSTPERSVNGRRQVGRGIRGARRIRADPVRLTDDLPSTHASARKCRRENRRPVIAAVLCIVVARARTDARRTAKLASHHDQRFVKHSARFQIVDQVPPLPGRSVAAADP